MIGSRRTTALGGFTVILARSKREIFVPQGETILHVLRDAGVHVPSNCNNGKCGVCELDVLSGIPRHRDTVLSDEEKASNQTVIACCAGSLTPELELDI